MVQSSLRWSVVMRAHIMYVGVLADAGYEKIHADFANKRYIVQIDKRVTTLVSYTFYRFSTMDSSPISFQSSAPHGTARAVNFIKVTAASFNQAYAIENPGPGILKSLIEIDVNIFQHQV